MRTKILHRAKLIIKVDSDRREGIITTVFVFDNRTQEYWSKDKIQERGIEYFLNIQDMKETLNWNLNGDESKYQFKWGQSRSKHSEGIAYIFQ